MKSNNYYFNVIIDYILSRRDQYSKHADRLFKVGERYVLVATDFFNQKNYESAATYFNPSIKLLSYGGPSAKLVSCWYQSAELFFNQKKYLRAVAAYQEVINISQNLPSLNFTNLNANQQSIKILFSCENKNEDKISKAEQHFNECEEKLSKKEVKVSEVNSIFSIN